MPRNKRPPVPTRRRLPAPLNDSPSFVLMQAGLLAHEWVADAVEPFGVTVTDYALLSVAYRIRGISQATLARKLGLGDAAVSRAVSALTAEHLLERRPDARYKRVALTQAGVISLIELAHEVDAVDHMLRKIVTARVRRLLAELPPEELPVALSALDPRWR